MRPDRRRTGRSGPYLLIGGDSEIASATASLLRGRGHAVAATTRRPERVAADRPFLDLALPLDNWEPPQGLRAACLCAAIARLQECASDPAGSMLVNVTRIVALADRLLARNIPVLFLSTDKVFDGSRPQVPVESPLCPASEYGRQKAAAETALGARMAEGAPVAILRLAKVVSPGMPLLRQWLASLAAGEPVRAFSDMMMAPTPAANVANAIECLLAEPARGIFQLSGPRDIAYSEVAAYLARKLGADPALVHQVSALSAGLPPGSTAPHTTLDSTALRDRFGIVVPDGWEVVDALAETCR
jgi:dTDP-4-dehydrorhamnose reductase